MFSVCDLLRYKPEVLGFDSRCDRQDFALTSYVRMHYVSTSNRNEYEGYLLGVKVAGA